VRQWNVENDTCMRIFKFADPISYTCVHEAHNLLFTGSWDKIVRAIDLKTAEVDRSFVASRDAIKCLHLYDKWLFVSGCDPVVRAYDLVTGAVKTFEGHKSWVLCIKTYK
jgi:WD40 repeat protein